MASQVSTQTQAQPLDDKTQDLRDVGMQEHLPPEDSEDYLTGIQLTTVVIGLCLATLCVALDNTIISTAIPRITDHFQQLDDVGWYGSAYLFTTCAFQLFFGKIYGLYSQKWIFMAALLIFEVGSLVCAVAPSSDAFIAGRAVAGLGGAGVLSGSLIIVAESVPLHKRPVFTSLMGGMFGIAGVTGPLIGGALTERVSWRWCFYINLPIGGVTALLLLIWLRGRKQSRHSFKSLGEHILNLDPFGNIIFLGAVICLLLALQMGGTTYAWSNARIIAEFVVSGVLLMVFCASQVLSPQWATVPPHIVRQRSVAFGAIFAFCVGASFFTFIFYLPYYFQAIKGASPLSSGVDILPLIIAQVIGTVGAGGLTTKIGYYMPFVLASIVFMSVGAGLLTTLEVDSPAHIWIGYQIIFGFGTGFGFEQAALAAQATLSRNDVATGTAFALFVQLLGGAIFVSVGNNVFTGQLISGIRAANIPNLNPETVISLGATQLSGIVDPAELPALLGAYMTALQHVYRVGLIMACLTSLGAVGMKWVNVKAANAAGAQAKH